MLVDSKCDRRSTQSRSSESCKLAISHGNGKYIPVSPALVDHLLTYSVLSDLIPFCGKTSPHPISVQSHKVHRRKIVILRYLCLSCLSYPLSLSSCLVLVLVLAIALTPSSQGIQGITQPIYPPFQTLIPSSQPPSIASVLFTPSPRRYRGQGILQRKFQNASLSSTSSTTFSLLL